MFNRTTLVILCIALAGGVGLLAAQRVFVGAPVTAPSGLEVVQLYPQPRPIPGFALQQSDGTQLLPGELAGHWTLVFIGFTHCPDVCPMTLTHLAQAQRQWETLPEATRPRVLFVSVDPERDTPDRLGDYAHAFHRDTLAATADVPTLEAFARSLSMVFAKVPLEADAPDGAYTIDHSASLAVLDPQGRVAGVVSGSVLNAETPRPDAIAADLSRLTAETRP
ncbi:SCO family protein [Luteimonas deserti]|uniref:SCO family protein n=1 Tax=Luteimonas deserti TaxID=2752306 RepID=A0A7Z0QS26_9GAMM|nr:SCO family protein [Luteimonas deserti]NYZ63834.1 SCO family protein [Luteimonas deserti]